MRYKHLKNKSDVDFRRLTGVTRQVFDTITKVVDDCKTRGRPHSLSCQDQVLVRLEYLRTYKTQLELSADYGISESNINRTIIKVENALIKSGQFNLPKRTHKPTHQDNNTVFEYVIIDVSKVPCQRPKKKQKRSYSGKQKQHTLKIQIIYNPNINQIISIRTDKGKTHDLTLARQYITRLSKLPVCACRQRLYWT